MRNENIENDWLNGSVIQGGQKITTYCNNKNPTKTKNVQL